MKSLGYRADLPRLLLLSHTPPGNSGVGQLFLRDLCDLYPHEKLAFGVVQQRFREDDLQQFSGIPKLYLSQSVSRQFNVKPRLLRVLLSHAEFYRQMWFEDRALVSGFVKFGSAQRIDKVWAVLNSPLIYRIAPLVASQLKVPLLVTVWDPPEGVGLHFGLDRLSRRISRKHFIAALRQAEKCGVISERMAQEYRDLYGTDNVVLRHGIAISGIRQPKKLDHSELRIGFCGSLYAESEWRTFLQALEQLQWRVDGTPIRVIVAGGHVPYLAARTPARFEYLGWRDMHEIIDVMCQCHLGYFPYWFHPAFAESVRLCFATKLTTYLTAGLPILYHGPKDAAVVDFFKRYPIAECCHSLNADLLAQSIRAMAEPERRQQRVASAIQAVHEELNLRIFHERFYQLVGSAQSDEDNVIRDLNRPNREAASTQYNGMLIPK